MLDAQRYHKHTLPDMSLPTKERTTSIYARTSDSYWKERRKKRDNKWLIKVSTAIMSAILTLTGSAFYINNARHPTVVEPIFVQQVPSHQTTETHSKHCESKVNSRQECVSICLPERNSIHRKIMHQACLHGCQQAHAASTAMGCRGTVGKEEGNSNRKDLIEEEVFKEVGKLAYNHCAKFQGIDPKPDVFATCRKYHRAGTKHGFRIAVENLRKVLDEELTGLTVEQ